MDGSRFDDLARSLAGMRTRRALLRALGLALGAGTVGAIALDDAGDAAQAACPNTLCAGRSPGRARTPASA